MKKTILIVSTACLLMVSAVYAETEQLMNLSNNPMNVKDIAISSFCKAILNGDIETVKH